MNAPRDTSYEDELIQSLTGPTEAAAYLDAVIALEDEPALQLALRQVAKAQGMAETARRADVGDKTLFKVLNAKSSPTLGTMNKVLHAMGLRLSVQPLTAAQGLLGNIQCGMAPTSQGCADHAV